MSSQVQRVADSEADGGPAHLALLRAAATGREIPLRRCGGPGSRGDLMGFLGKIYDLMLV